MAKTCITLSLIFIFLFKTTALDDLNASFSWEEKLEIKLCNQTYHFVSVLDGLESDRFGDLLYSEQLSVAFKTSTGDIEIQNGPLKDLPSCCAYISKKIYIAPNQCLNKTVDIRSYLPETAELFQIHLTVYGGHISGSYVPPIDGITFKSPWFHLQPHEK